MAVQPMCKLKAAGSRLLWGSAVNVIQSGAAFDVIAMHGAHRDH